MCGSHSVGVWLLLGATSGSPGLLATEALLWIGLAIPGGNIFSRFLDDGTVEEPTQCQQRGRDALSGHLQGAQSSDLMNRPLMGQGARFRAYRDSFCMMQATERRPSFQRLRGLGSRCISQHGAGSALLSYFRLYPSLARQQDVLAQLYC